jgi:hypothetical protein
LRKRTSAVAVVIVALAASGSTLATMEIQKEYRAKDPKANCLTCHVDKLPKKDRHEWNDFGKKVAEAKGKDGKIDWSKVPAPK